MFKAKDMPEKVGVKMFQKQCIFSINVQQRKCRIKHDMKHGQV